jgi:hypothetical protein
MPPLSLSNLKVTQVPSSDLGRLVEGLAPTDRLVVIVKMKEGFPLPAPVKVRSHIAGSIYTAEVMVQDFNALTQHPEVDSVSLSQTLRQPTGNDA